VERCAFFIAGSCSTSSGGTARFPARSGRPLVFEKEKRRKGVKEKRRRGEEEKRRKGAKVKRGKGQ
jgi:hypothetical protein